MNRRLTKFRSAGMPIAHVLPRSHMTIAVSYLAVYVLLDWISYVHPFSVSGITPWNPQTGLSFALILLFGLKFLPWLFIAPLVSNLLVRQFALPIGAEILVASAIGLGYGAATAFMLSPRISFDPTLSSKRSLQILMAVAIVSIALVSVAHALALVVFDILRPSDLVQAALRSFVGDVIGVAVLTPFILIALTRRRLPVVSWELVALHMIVIAALWLVFGFADANRLQLFYVLFLPMIWTAVRFGLEGVTTALVVTQIGLILAIQLSNGSAIDVTAFQALMVVLSLTGLALGVLVNEQHQAQQRLRLQQEALSRAGRVSTMGEFAAAVAHEINQPLTAIANFARLAKRAVSQQPPDARSVVSALDSAIEQVERAGTVLRRLRDFIRLGRSETQAVGVDHLVATAWSICRPELDRLGIRFETRGLRGLPDVFVDPIQIQQVIVNLVRNAAEALACAGRQDGLIVAEGSDGPDERVWIRICDNGPGFDPSVEKQSIMPFTTTKPDGLGLGLSLARSIIEAHGGRIEIDSSSRGTKVGFSVAVAEGVESAA